MDKMKMETANKTLDNLAKLKEMFPEVITESKDENGEIVAAVDAKKLEQLLSTKVIDGDESYDFTWVGKKQAMIEACKPIRKTLRPCREESVDWENTQNLYIEGDNLDVLKLLQESYLNKVKMIYIDPPYNTGKDSFIYPDDYSTNKDAYDEEVGAIDESGYRMFKNSETNGRFHSSWCSMMYPLLKLARNILTEEGIIFISIDYHEVGNLRKLCDEVFGGINYYATLNWIATNKAMNSGDAKYKIQDCDESILVYGKIPMPQHKPFHLESMGEKCYPYKNETGKEYRLEEIQQRKNIGIKRSEKMVFSILSTMPKEGYRWTIGEKTARLLEMSNDVILKNGKPIRKIYKSDEICESFYPIWADFSDSCGTSENGKAELFDILQQEHGFETVKPISLIKKILFHFSDKDSTILDFFSGSATTAHAVMQLNAEDDGNRKFIMVQLPEVCDEKSETYKAGYKNICEIGKERIRRAGKKIVEETGKKDLDIGFRVLKLADGNMKDVYYTPEEYNQKDLADMASNIKDDRTPEDLLYACMLEWGLELSLPHKVQTIAGYNVHIVDDGALVACFDDRISEDAIKQIAELQPLRAVFRDSGFAGDAARVNVGEIFKLKSPNTTIKVL